MDLTVECEQAKVTEIYFCRRLLRTVIFLQVLHNIQFKNHALCITKLNLSIYCGYQRDGSMSALDRCHYKEVHVVLPLSSNRY